ncbi:MAG: single-stranded DNA-binding protein [Micromonosporaceae bacterium]
MLDTYVTIVGNVLHTPEWRRTNNTGTVVVSFKVASTARRLNRETGQWVDGNSLRVRVTCWRRLAEGVGASVKAGDPVVVVGRLYTREWEDETGARRLAYEVEAVAVGHDLSKGRAQFARVKPTLSTSMVEDADAESRARGELTSVLPAEEVPVPPPSDLTDDPEAGWPEPPGTREPQQSDAEVATASAPADEGAEAEPGHRRRGRNREPVPA